MSETHDLVRRARAGDRDAWSIVYGRHARVVHAVVLARIPAQDAEDLVQEVFLEAWRSLDGLRDASRFGAWLSGIARNLTRSYHRRRRPGPHPLPEALEDPRPQDASQELRGEEVLAMIRDLPEAYRESLTLRLVEGLSGEEIARAIGLTPGSVRVNLHRGMKLLRARLEEAGLGGPTAEAAS